MTKEAWVTVVTNDTYGLGALVLGSSLRRVGTSRDTVVMVTPGVSERMREELARVYTRVVEVDVLDSGDTANLALLARPELGVTFTKLHAWTLIDYTKCVFLDADTLLIQNSDELFEREELSAAPDPGWPDCFNSGVFVFVPNMVTYQALLDFAIAHGSFDGGDQGLLNMFFREWATLDIKKHLPFVYNLVASTAYTYLPALKFFGNEVKIVHFLGGSKPWTKQGYASSSRPYHRAWWSIFREDISPQLHQEMILCSSLTGSGRETSSTIQHKFQDPWSSWKPESDRQASNIPNHRQTDDHDLPTSGQSTFLTDDHPSRAQLTLLTDDHPTLHADEHSTNGQFTLLKPTQLQVHHKNDKENSCTDTMILEEQNDFNSSKNLTSETQINKNNSSLKIQVIENLPFLPLNNKLTINNKLESDQTEIFSKENRNNIQTSALQHTVQILETYNDLTLNEKDKTKGILEPCFLLNDSDSTRGECTFTGVPGALARGDTEEWRKEAWESGDVDYLGRDSFDNIWQRICECVGITSAQPKETAEIQPAAGASDKPIEQTKEETPAKPTVSTQSAESPAPPSVPAEAGSQPGVQADDLPKPAVPQETTAQSDVTQESAPLPVVSQELSPQESAPQPPVLQGTAPQPAVPLETTPQPATLSESVSQPAAPSESVPQPAAPSESVPQPALPLESVPQPALSSESGPQPALSSESSPLPVAPLETACQPAVSLELAAEPAVPSEAVPEPAVQTEVTPQPAKPSEGIVQLEVQTEAITQPQLPIEVPPSESPAQPSESPARPSESSAQTPVPADTTSQSAVPLEAASQQVVPQHTADEETKPAEISVQPTTPVEATVPAIAATEILAQPTVESKSTESLEQLTASPDISSQDAQTDTSTVPTDSPIKPSETTKASAESAVPVPPDSTVPPDASVQPLPTPEIPAADLKQETVPVETEKKSTDSPKCTEAPEVCCRKPEACSKPSTQAGQSKESVCPKPEKKPKETPKLPLIPSEAPSAAQVETSSSEGAACPKEPGTPTVTPPSGPGSPLVADIPEVCKLQATSSQPSTPPVPETEGSEPPVPPKRKQAKNGKPVPKGGKK